MPPPISGIDLNSSLVLFLMSCVSWLGPFFEGINIRVELIYGLVLFWGSCVSWPGPFFEGILYSSRVNTWPGPFLNELCVAAWSFFEEVNIKVELIHGLVLF